MPLHDEFDKFKGTFPYASELFGVYQPLLSWRARSKQFHVDEERKGLVDAVIQEVAKDGHFVEQENLLPGGDLRFSRSLRWYRGSPLLQRIQHKVKEFQTTRRRRPQGAEWHSIVSSETAQPANAGPAMRDAHQARKDAAVAMTLLALSLKAPELLGSIIEPQKAPWERALDFFDPLSNFDAQTMEAFLSPIGLIHLYRQYFFEFGSFLGPPVEHIWLSPGGRVELVEVKARRTTTEHVQEFIEEILNRSEIASVEQDEISDAVKQENRRNMNFASSVNAGVNLVVFNAQASANFGFETTRQQSNEITHKHMRQQTEKLSSEIRRNFRSTFRTFSEATDTSSRTYVLNNTTEKLVNYELRRKMRKVGVQVQHIGTRLCWQYIVPNPGADMGIAELVHVAKREDIKAGNPNTEQKAQRQRKEEQFEVFIPHVITEPPNEEDTWEMFGNGRVVNGLWTLKNLDANVIVGEWLLRAEFDFEALPPEDGYILHQQVVKDWQSAIGGNRDETNQPHVVPEFGRVSDTKFKVKLNEVNFRGHNSFVIPVTLVWEPVPVPQGQTSAQPDVEQEKKNRRDAYVEYVRAVRERIVLASEIKRRPAMDLREEERILIYRTLIQKLMEVGRDRPKHVTSELIQSLFEVDKMLYFVAPEWWRPRERHHQQVLPAPEAGQTPAPTSRETELLGRLGVLQEEGGPRRLISTSGPAGSALSESDRVGWGGIGAQRRDNYLITEESRPAPLGSSLGWLIQLDGDEQRNAFLNSPWVKATIPIRPGREAAAIGWLERLEGVEGLDLPYTGTEPELHGLTVREALTKLADQIGKSERDFSNTLAAETVFEKGFDPLAGGVRINQAPYKVFDQWVEVLPTDQVVAQEYDAQKHS